MKYITDNDELVKALNKLDDTRRALYAQPTVKAALYCGKVPSPGLVP